VVEHQGWLAGILAGRDKAGDLARGHLLRWRGRRSRPVAPVKPGR
jgi:hypothetical protein